MGTNFWGKLVLVVVVVFELLGAGAILGYRYAEGRCAVEKSADVAAATKQFNEDLRAAKDSAAAAETAARAAAERETTAKNKLSITLRKIRNATLPIACVPDDLRLRVNEAIGAINDYRYPAAGDPGRLPVALPGPAAP